MKVIIGLSEIEVLLREKGVNLHLRVSQDGCLELGHQIFCFKGLMSKIGNKLKSWFCKSEAENTETKIGFITLPHISCSGTHLLVKLESSVGKKLATILSDCQKPGMVVQTENGLEIRLEEIEVVANLKGALDVKSLEFEGDEVYAEISFNINPLL